MSDPTYEQSVADAKTRVQEIAPRDAVAERADRPDTVFVDVREPNEWSLFRIPGALHAPIGTLAEQIESQLPKERRAIVYCARGNRSALAADQLQQMGYMDVVSLADGIRGWVGAGGDVEE
ncbi:MAG: rhodanese-like domain-containing protein [Gemmatimonadaceae bacterium]